MSVFVDPGVSGDDLVVEIRAWLDKSSVRREDQESCRQGCSCGICTPRQFIIVDSDAGAFVGRHC